MKGKKMKVVVIGGGPAGMMAAITSAKEGNNVTLLEKNDRCGKKLLITGKGRCNITSSLGMDEFINNIPGNGRFLYSAFQNFTNQDILEMLHKNSVDTKEERGEEFIKTFKYELIKGNEYLIYYNDKNNILIFYKK